MRQFRRLMFLLSAVLWLLPVTTTHGEIRHLFAKKQRFCLPAEQTVWVHPRGPDEVPCCLEGRWKVSLCIECQHAKFGHAWIRFEHTETGEAHTSALYNKGFGGVRDADTGRWMYRPAPADGLQWDLDMQREHLISSRQVLIVTTLVDNPRIYRGRNNGYGHGCIVNNCVTYARDAWFYYSGECYELQSGCHTADTLLRGVCQQHPEARSAGN
jgi:hypothetical protein